MIRQIIVRSSCHLKLIDFRIRFCLNPRQNVWVESLYYNDISDFTSLRYISISILNRSKLTRKKLKLGNLGPSGLVTECKCPVCRSIFSLARLKLLYLD